MTRTALEDALWSLGKLDADKQAQLDAACRGRRVDLPDCLAVSVDQERYALRIWHPLSETPPSLIKLPQPTGTHRPERPVAQPIVTCFAPDGQKQGDLPVAVAPTLGIVGGQVYRLPDPITATSWLSRAHLVFANVVPAPGSTYGPLDLAIKPDGQEALVIDRLQGALIHVDLTEPSVRRRIKARVAGTTGALTVAWIDNRVFVADASAEAISVFDLRDGEPADAPAGFGRVTGILASRDGLRLYLLATKPAMQLHVLDADSFETIRSIPILGDPFSRFGDPADILAMAPDERHVAVMSCTDDPQPQTPVVTLCDVETGRTQRRLRLQANRKPVGLGFGVDNPFHADLEPIESALVRLGILTAEELTALQASLTAQPIAAPTTEDGPPPAKELPVELSSLAGGDLWRNSAIMPAAALALPLELEPILAEHVQRTFRERAGIDVAEDELAWQRVTEAATAAREFLEQHTACEIILPELAPSQDLHLLVTREQVQEWLLVLDQLDAALAEALEEVESAQGTLSAPDRCPSCQTPLLGAYTCPACGHRVKEGPAVDPIPASAKPKVKPKPNTTDSRLFLPPDHLLLADPPRQRIVELDRKGRVVWQMQADRRQEDLQRLLQWPVDALRLANENTLVIDRVARRVFEVTREGRPYWEWPSEAGTLLEPVRVARSEWGETFIVDRLGHRIWRADANGKPLSGYGQGKPGMGEGQLCSPSDVQVLTNGHLVIADTGNHRVIEVADGRIVWQFGNKDRQGNQGDGDDDDSLRQPRRAMRIEGGRTLIVDSGNHRLLIVNRQGRILWRFDTLSGDERLAMDRPLGAMRVGQDHVVYWDDVCLVEIDRQGQVIWAAQFARLDMNARMETRAAESGQLATGAPRRLWEVQRLRDGDPEVLAEQAERQRKRQGVAQARKAWFSGDTSTYIALLKAESARRLAEAAGKKVWNIDWEAVQRRTAEIRARLDPALRKEAPPDKPLETTAVTPTAPKAEPAFTNPDKRPVELLVVQATRSRVLLMAQDQSVLWTWGENTLSEPHAASLLPSWRALIVDTGHSRLVEVDMTSNEVVWESPAALGLSYPKAAQRLENGNTLIADTGNRRLLEIDPQGAVVWDWRHEEWLQVPTACERTSDGRTMVTDWGNHQVFDILPDGTVGWSYGQRGVGSRTPGFLNYPEYAHRRPSGHTLIVDGRNNRLLEVDPGGTISWSYAGEGVKRLSGPTTALRLGDQTTLVVHGAGRQVFRVNRAGEIVWKATVPD
jgi:uncharacterized Zn finger protein (UPF0148 family)